MATPSSLAISGANFESIRERLDDGFGLFVDSGFTYVVLDGLTHAIDVLRRQDDRLWSEVMVEQPSVVRVCVNGQIFGPAGLYTKVNLAGALDPDIVEGHGSIRKAGRTFAEDRVHGKNRYFFGRSRDGARYTCQLENPPDDVYEGMGGLGPLIVTNPATGQGVPVAAHNRYASDTSKTTFPVTADEWRDCTQRSSKHYEQIDSLDPATFCAVASNSAARLLLFVANDTASEGRLSMLRDKLLDAGFDCAAFTDGSTSTCMAVDGEMIVEPNPIKDRLIEAGFKGVKGSKPISLRVTFKTVEVLDPAVIEGDEGEWTIMGKVNGAEAGTFESARVFDGHVLQLGWVEELEVSSADELRIRLEVVNEVGPTLTGVDPPEIGDFEERVNFESEPTFGEGAWVLTHRDDFYRLRYEIEVL